MNTSTPNSVRKRKPGAKLTWAYALLKFLKDVDATKLKYYANIPFTEAEKAIAHYHKLGIDPMSKTLVFSDGLDLDTALALYQRFADRIQLGFGIGTRLTNDMGLETINIVMKLTHANGQPVAKISDSPGKTLCNDETYLAYLRQVFGLAQPVAV